MNDFLFFILAKVFAFLSSQPIGSRMKRYTDNDFIKNLTNRISSDGLDSKIYSDVVDSDGNQYVDLVQEGGGLFGIALLGYTYVLERANIRFFSLAGTSAGAINSMMMAALSKVGEPVSLRTLDMLTGKDLSELVDGDQRVWNFIRRYMQNGIRMYPRIFLNLPRAIKSIRRELGLNPGMEFEKWISSHLTSNGIHTLYDLEHHRSMLPKLVDRNSGKRIKKKPQLKLITSDVTSKSKITFPDMAELYWHNPNEVNPALFVRASISIPFFFMPMIVNNIPGAGSYEDTELPKNKTRWRKHTGYRGKIPETVHFVDGGMLSNFPIHAFHQKGVPLKPTFGARLSTWRTEAYPIEGFQAFCNAMVGTMRQLHDYDFLLQHPDYKHLICSIDCDAQLDEQGRKRFNYLDFEMEESIKIKLFQHGAQKAFDFLTKFNWEKYKQIREEMVGF